MSIRKTAEHHPARDGEMLRTEKIEQLQRLINKGDYEVENKFQKIVDSFVNEFVR
jgi:anti-sigma28 factor (negative regulator of flagellin synthesis)